MPPPRPVSLTTRLLLALIRRYPEWRGRYQVIDLAQSLTGLVCGGMLLLLPDRAYEHPIFAYIWPNATAGSALGLAWVLSAVLLLFSRYNADRWHGAWPTVHTFAALLCGWVTGYVGLGAVLGATALGLPPVASLAALLPGVVASLNAVVRAFAEIIPPLPPPPCSPADGEEVPA